MVSDKIDRKLLIEASKSLRRKIIVGLREIKEILKYCHIGIKEWKKSIKQKKSNYNLSSKIS